MFTLYSLLHTKYKNSTAIIIIIIIMMYIYFTIDYGNAYCDSTFYFKMSYSFRLKIKMWKKMKRKINKKATTDVSNYTKDFSELQRM